MTLRFVVLGVVGDVLFAGAAVAPASAAVRDCSWNLVRAKPAGSYLTVTSVRNMSCSQAKRTARRAQLDFSPANAHGRLVVRAYVHGRHLGPGPDAQFRCVRGGRAFRVTARP